MTSATQSASPATTQRSSAAERTVTLDIETTRTITRDEIRELFLHGLSHEERLLAILWYVERMTPDEIAEALDVTVAQVRVDHSRIIQKLG
jgi:RNA polymerase sigma factor (sigma-70 family)